MRLTCIAQKEVTFSDGGKKVKHLFVDEKGAAFTGWTDQGEQMPADQLSSTGAYDSARARDYDVDVDEYEGKLRYRVKL